MGVTRGAHLTSSDGRTGLKGNSTPKFTGDTL